MTRVANMRRGEPYDVYVGRAGRGMTGLFGNPYKVGEFCQRCRQRHESGGETLPCFRAYFEERVKYDRAFRLQVLRLRGKTLGCFCVPQPCHAVIIAEWIDSQETLC